MASEASGSSSSRLPAGLLLGTISVVLLAGFSAPTPAQAALTPAAPAAAPLPAAVQPAVVGAAQAVSCPTPPALPLTEGSGAGRTVTLTFDDGPGADTPQILDILRNAQVPATFFVLGSSAREFPDLVRRMAAEGHVVANHSWSHDQMTRKDATAQAAEMDNTSAEIEALTGRRPCLFRPPYGAENKTTRALARERDMAVSLWSIDTRDWKRPSSAAITATATAVGEQQHPVVLFHDGGGNRTQTVAALPAVIDFYRSHGFTFVASPGYPPVGSALAIAPRGVLR